MEILGELWKLVWYFFENGSFPTMELKIEHLDAHANVWVESALGIFRFNQVNSTAGGAKTTTRITEGSNAADGSKGAP